LKNEIKWEYYYNKELSDNDLWRLFKTTSIHEFIERCKDAINKIPFVSNEELAAMLDSCHNLRNYERLKHHPDEFRKVLRTKSLDYLEKYQKKMLHVMKLCREMCEHYALRHAKGIGLVGSRSSTNSSFLFERIDEGIEKERIENKD